jgi:ribosome maturation factor RimP
MSWQGAVERTVTGLGYDLVDTDKGVGGLLRVFIDQPAALAGEPSAPVITVDDCEKVTRQLQHVLEVEGCSYERLEVSSPGLDRPLKKPADYARFAGEQVEVTLKVPFKGRKKYRGELMSLGDGAQWRLVLAEDDGSVRPTRSERRAKAVGAATPAADANAGAQALDFALDEVREARLFPVVDFKGRRFAAAEPLADGLAQPLPAPEPNVGMDGGRIQ